ncbi:hypothetical protein [Sphingomonas bisphenolicum]|uniref:Uncharacterized protein n=1 Tax=Sphingomonas bisphenolicum TaxID=296544 RepID=A0ABN5W845_9SPHN|nr:hypothetical protein [Sphingomonas bisphenolicum]BBF68397.1 hypothetical protein SBA_ch1_05970 [Sphingomonas bisphenolicum]
MLGFFLMVVAQALGAAATLPPASCRVVSERTEHGDGTRLIGVCDKSAIVLGTVTSFESAVHVATGSAAVVIKGGASIKVLVVRPLEDGTAFLENVTGDLARQSGRVPEVGLDGMAVDLSKFASESIITAHLDSEDNIEIHQVKISVASMIDQEVARQKSK